MANMAVTYAFSGGGHAVADEVNTNFGDVVSHLNASVVLADGSRAMTGALTLPASEPTAANHATRKSYVDQYTDSAVWKLPWGPAAPGVIEATTNSAGIGAKWEAILPSIAFTQAEGRRYRVSALAVVSAAAGTRAYLGIVLWGQTIPVRQVSCYLTTYQTSTLVVTYEYNATTTNSVTYTQALYGDTALVTGVGTGIERRQIWVDDIGSWKAKP